MIVMKFGGTSIQDASGVNRAVNIIKGRLDAHENVVVIVSAMGKITNKLTELAFASSEGRQKEQKILFNYVKSYHNQMLDKLCGRDASFRAAQAQLSKKFCRLSDLTGCGGLIFGLKKLTPKNIDSVISFGEQFSSLIINAAMNSRGIKTKLVDAPKFMITDKSHTCANPVFDEVYKKIPAAILKHFKKHKAVLTQGFIGRTKNGAPTTIGREGSDCTATIVGAGLDAEKIEIWTDVNGVMTADPRIVKTAKNIPFISYDDMAHLSFCGAKVIHPGTVAPAKSKKIPVYVLNTYNKKHAGTVIHHNKRAASRKNLNDIISVTAKSGVLAVELKNPSKKAVYDFTDRFLFLAKKKNIIIDQVFMSGSKVAFLLKQDNPEIWPIIRKLHADFDLEASQDKSIIYIIGRNMVYMGKIRATIDTLIEKEKAVIWEISGNTIALLTGSAAAEEIIRYLHEELL